ncbi:hypothetical protein BGX28_005439, partial [Mortierella sp. GBA30]
MGLDHADKDEFDTIVESLEDRNQHRNARESLQRFVNECIYEPHEYKEMLDAAENDQ